MTAIVALAVATFGIFFLSARPVPHSLPVPAAPQKEESITDKYANMDEQQLINSLPEDYLRALSRQKFLVASGLQPPRSTREILELVAASNGINADPKIVAIINAMTKLEEQSGSYLYLQGSRYLENKQYDLAIEKFNEAIRLGDMESYHSRGVAWLGKQEYERAIADFTQAAKLEHQSYSIYISRAEATEKKGDRDASIADYRRALVLAPDKATSDQIKTALKRLGYVENGISADFNRGARPNRR